MHFTLQNMSNMIENTLKPDGANGTSKFIEIGGLVHFFFVSVSNSSISADSCVSFIPAIRLILFLLEEKHTFYFVIDFEIIHLIQQLWYLLPDNCIFWGLVFCLTLQTNQLHTRCIQGSRNFYLDFLTQQWWLEIWFKHHLPKRNGLIFNN